MTLATNIGDALKAAMRSKDETRLDVLRALRGEIIKFEKSGTDDAITDDKVVKIVKSQIKQRQDAIAMFQKGGRNDLVEREEAQIVVLAEFLPPQLSEEEIGALIASAIEEIGASTMKDMGKVMKQVNGAIRDSGKDADNRVVSGLVKAALS